MIPAVLYYIALTAAIHLNGKLKKLTPTDKDKLPGFWLALKNGGHLLLSLMVLRGHAAVMAAFWGILALFITPRLCLPPLKR